MKWFNFIKKSKKGNKKCKCFMLSCSILSDSLQPFGLQPARLLYPWDSPGKNTGVGCHFLLQEDLPNPEVESGSPISSVLQADSLHTEPSRKLITCCQIMDVWWHWLNTVVTSVLEKGKLMDGHIPLAKWVTWPCLIWGGRASSIFIQNEGSQWMYQ